MKPSTCFPLVLAFLTASCGTARPVLESDSTRVEVNTVVETIHDTAYVELPVIVEKVATLDTASMLENKYAKSAALVSGCPLPPNSEQRLPSKSEQLKIICKGYRLALLVVERGEAERNGEQGQPAAFRSPYY